MVGNATLPSNAHAFHDLTKSANLCALPNLLRLDKGSGVNKDGHLPVHRCVFLHELFSLACLVKAARSLVNLPAVRPAIALCIHYLSSVRITDKPAEKCCKSLAFSPRNKAILS
jgi:hypothetical protein